MNAILNAGTAIPSLGTVPAGQVGLLLAWNMPSADALRIVGSAAALWFCRGVFPAGYAEPAGWEGMTFEQRVAEFGKLSNTQKLGVVERYTAMSVNGAYLEYEVAQAANSAAANATAASTIRLG